MTSENITLSDLIDLIHTQREAEILAAMDERYQKGFRDALDILEKWLIRGRSLIQ